MMKSDKPRWLQGYIDEVRKEIEHLGSGNEDEDPEAIERYEVAITALKWSLGVLSRHVLMAQAYSAFDKNPAPVQ